MGLLKSQKEIDAMSKDELFAEAIRLSDLNKMVNKHGKGYLLRLKRRETARQEQNCNQ